MPDTQFEDLYSALNVALADRRQPMRVSPASSAEEIKAALDALYRAFKTVERDSDVDVRTRGLKGIQLVVRAKKRLLDEAQRREYDAEWRRHATASPPPTAGPAPPPGWGSGPSPSPPPSLIAPIAPIAFGTLEQGKPATVQCQLTFLGNGRLTGRVRSTLPWVSVRPRIFSAGPTATLTVTARTDRAPEGAFASEHGLLVEVPGREPISVEISGEVSSPPAAAEESAQPAGTDASEHPGPPQSGPVPWGNLKAPPWWIVGGATLLAAAGFRAWCLAAIPATRGMFEWAFTPASIGAQFCGGVALRLGWASLQERLAKGSGFTPGLARAVLTSGILAVLIGAARWIWTPVDTIDLALKPVVTHCGEPASWGIAGGVLGSAIAAAFGCGVALPVRFPRRAAAWAGAFAACGLLAAPLAPMVRDGLLPAIMRISQQGPKGSPGGGSGDPPPDNGPGPEPKPQPPPPGPTPQQLRAAGLANRAAEQVTFIADKLKQPPPKDPAALEKLRRELKERAHTADADAEQSIALDPNKPRAYHLRVSALRYLGQYDAAATFLHSARALFPRDPSLVRDEDADATRHSGAG